MDKLKNLLFLIILVNISVALLEGLKNYTLPYIKVYRDKVLKTNILKAAGVEFDEEDYQEVFNNSIRVRKKKDLTYYLSPEGYYILEFTDRGMWDLISGLVVLDKDKKTIRQIRIISQRETPGLGGRISEEKFWKKFQKKIYPLSLLVRKKATGKNEIDAISGASITSGAVVRMVNRVIERFRR